jgi:hypothetical protein
MKVKLVGLICIIALASVQSVGAKDKEQANRGVEDKPGKHQVASGAKADVAEQGAPIKVKFNISDDERRIIRTYVEGHRGRGFGKKSKSLPPGLAKKVARGEQLPPGWQKKCVPGEIMPVEVLEKCHSLPPELVVKLPRSPEPTITVTIGGQIVRLIKATREILDVFNVHSP